ncbi:sigma-70 family RNA polymerase sigma factor [Candidatus Woesearchaeota archaeon]|nr:sigma-70 family RNA polymerase sigma factor [Candidatus Woesearchaeota archaeon]
MQLKQYASDLSKYPLISRLEENRLAKKIHTRKKINIEPRNKLVEANLRLVPLFLKRYVNQANGNLNDLIQEGNIGLIEAAERYDPSYIVRFSTYAEYYVRRKIVAYITENHKIGHLPNSTAQAMRIVRKEIDRYYVENGRTPTYIELNYRLKKAKNRNVWHLSKERINELIQLGKFVDPISLEAQVYNDKSLSDYLRDENENAEAIENRIDEKMSKEKLEIALGLLEPVYRKILILSYGLKDHKIRTYREVAEIIGTSRQNVFKLEAKALRKLKQYYFINNNKNNSKEKYL